MKETSRVMLLMKSNTYRARDFMEAAEQLGIEIVKVVDAPRFLAQSQEYLLATDFKDVTEATSAIVAFARERSAQAILAVDDSGSLLAAEACQALGLPHNDPAAALAARDKFRMRTLMAERGVPVPHFRRFSTAADPRSVAQEVTYPCVVKPLRLSGSRGVIRADDPGELIRAVHRLADILKDMEEDSGPASYLVEDYIPGIEVALEGLLEEGQLHVLALFDKPDPLQGPYFEETIYVTPSRLPRPTQDAIARQATQAAAALGLRRGPVHAELRVNDDGPWILEIAGRSIGGLCARTLRFGVDASLESLILRQAVGQQIPNLARERTARGVMMIPIPGQGLLKGYSGVEKAEALPRITGVEITAPLNHLIKPLPEGESYLGFIFAQAETPSEVEAALRRAHQELRFQIAPVLPLRAG